MDAFSPKEILTLLPALRSLTMQLSHNEPTANRFDGWSLSDRDPAVLEQMMPLMAWAYRHYYRVSTSGWENVPADEPVMFIGSHNGGIAAPDLHMMLYDWCRYFGTQKPLYGLMHPEVWTATPAVARIAAQMGAVKAHPKMGIAALNAGHSIVVYPGGASDVFRPWRDRHKIYFHNRKGFIKLALKKGVPIVPLISTGAHSTFFVLTDIYPLMEQLHQQGLPWLFGVDPEVFPIYLGLPWIIGIGPVPHLPLPVKIRTRVCQPIRFERTGANAAKDRAYVDACYEKVRAQMQTALDRLVAEQI